MKNIVLFGFMGCGKSTVGALLAQQTGRLLLDTDGYLESQAGRTIPEIFAADGEACSVLRRRHGAGRGKCRLVGERRAYGVPERRV